jgi:hypothetical protein
MDIANILTIFAPVITAIMIGIAAVIGIFMKRWENRENEKLVAEKARSQLKIMQDNASLSVMAVQQMYWDKPNEEKKQLALQIAKSLNGVAGINTTDGEQISLNEASVYSVKHVGEKREIPATDTRIEGVG